MSIISLLGARGQRASSVRHEAAFTFDDTVALFNADLVSYWKFQNTGTDQQAISNATLNGFPELNVPTIVKNDSIDSGAGSDGTCIAWSAATGDYAEAAHNVAHKTAAGTVVVYFQRDTAAQKSQLIIADQTPVAVGGMAIGVTATGAIDAHIRGAGGTPVTLVGGSGDVQLDRAYVLIFKWGTGGGMRLALWDDTATLVRFVTNTGSTIGLSGTSPIRFGATHADTNNHDGPYGRVLWLDRRIGDAEELLLAQALTIPRDTGAYRTLELSFSPLALWGLGEAFGTVITDAVEGRNGTYVGAIAHNALDLPANNAGGAIDFLATGSGSIPHNPAFALASFSLSFWVRPNTLPGEGQPALPLFTKAASAATHGNFAITIADVDTGLRVRFRNAALTAVDLNAPPEVMELGLAHHVCVRADNTGFDLHIDGKFYGKNTGYLNAWTPNSQPIGLASGAGFSLTGNCVLDEVALYAYKLTDVQVIQLAQRSGILPVAVEDFAQVSENTPTTAIHILANDEYAGTPTISLLSQPSPDTATIVAGVPPFINYESGNVAVDTDRSFNYRINDPNGQSNTAAVSVRVIADDTVVVTNANCYTIPGASSETLPGTGTMAALEAAVNAAPAGRHILIPAGTYAGGSLQFNAQGTAANPIVIRPVGARGSVIINNATWTLQPTTTRLVITNLHFNDPRWSVRGTHNRISRCIIRDISGRAVRFVNATDCRIDHCDFMGFTTPETGFIKCFIDYDYASISSGALRRILCDYNYLHDVVLSSPNDIAGMHVAAASSAGAGEATTCGVIIDHCLFNNVNVAPGHRVISVKTGGVKIQYCTIFNCTQSFINNPRTCGFCETRSCWFENTNQTPLQVYGSNHLVIGNNIRTPGAGVRVWSGEGYYPAIGSGVAAVRDSRFVGNRFHSGTLRVGEFVSSNQQVCTTPARDNNIAMSGPGINVREAGGNPYTLDMTSLQPGNLPAQTGTTFNPDSEPFVPATRLFPADVGLDVADDLCPLGPQS